MLYGEDTSAGEGGASVARRGAIAIFNRRQGRWEGQEHERRAAWHGLRLRILKNARNHERDIARCHASLYLQQIQAQRP